MGSVNVTLANGGLGGTIQTDDGILGIVLTGQIEDDLVLGTPILVTGMASVEAAHITEDGNPFAYRHLQDFYTLAGDGAQLYVMLVPNSMNVADILDNTDDTGARALLNYAAGKIKVLFVMTDDVNIDTPIIAAALNADIPQAIINAEVLAAAYFEEQQPFRVVIGGTSYTGVAGDLAAMNSGTTSNRTAILIGDTEGEDGVSEGTGACIGLLAGLVATLPVMRKISRVRNKALPTLTAYVGTVAIGATGSDEAVIAGKGYITFKRYPGKTGFFFSSDPMCTATTDDYKFLCRGRIMDKAHILSYLTFLEYVDDEVPYDPTTGKMSVSYCRSLEQNIENQINNTMTANEEISSVKAYVNPDQNVLSTEEVEINIGIVPVGYSTIINIVLGFKNPALA